MIKELREMAVAGLQCTIFMMAASAVWFVLSKI